MIRIREWTDGLWPDEELIACHIPVRCRGGFEGQLPFVDEVVPNSDAVEAIVRAAQDEKCHAVAVVGSAGTGKTAALKWFLYRCAPELSSANVLAFCCSSRSGGDLGAFLAEACTSESVQWVVIDGIDELVGDVPYSLDELLRPVRSRLASRSLRLVFSVRPDGIGRSLLEVPAEALSGRREWGSGWAGVETLVGLRVAVLRLQGLRPTDVETYAALRGLTADAVQHLRSLYDLRELVRRFFLLVKLCDLSSVLRPEEWKQIRARGELYHRLLTTWLRTEHERHPERLPLKEDELLGVLECLTLEINRWTRNLGGNSSRGLAALIAELGQGKPWEAAADGIASALIGSNIVEDTGFTHKSIEEFLLASALARALASGQQQWISPERVTDEVIDFLAEDKTFRAWLDHAQDSLDVVWSEYYTYLVRILHRTGRSVSGLDLRDARLSNLDVPGIRLKKADLRGATLERTRLGPADLSDSDLRGANLRDTSVWSTTGATGLHSSADGADRVWLIHPSAGRPMGLGLLLYIGFDTGRIVAHRTYDPRSERLCADGRTVYRIPQSLRSSAECIQWRGESLTDTSWLVAPDAMPLASTVVLGAVWQISSHHAELYSESGRLIGFAFGGGVVRGVFAVSLAGELAASRVDGFCLIGTKLWAISPDQFLLLTDDLPLDCDSHQMVAVGEESIFFRTRCGWSRWGARANLPPTTSSLDEVRRVVSIPNGGYALLRDGAIHFADENLIVLASQRCDIPDGNQIVGIRRGRRAAVVVLGQHGLWLVDEQSGREDIRWLELKATGARFDKTTIVDRNLRSALVQAGARDASTLAMPPPLENAISEGRLDFGSRFDVLLITVNEHEFDAVWAMAQTRMGRDPIEVPLKHRMYFDLGMVGGMRLGMVQSQMGSTQPGASTATTLQAMSEVHPGYIIGVGIAFGVDPDKQAPGQILISAKLQDYNLKKVATDERTGRRMIVPRGDKVSANPVFLNRVDAVAAIWRQRRRDIRITSGLVLTGESLVDEYDYREELRSRFPEAIGGEMEATGIYSAASEDKTSWLIIKAISDFADGKKKEDKEERQKLAARNATEFVFFMLDTAQLPR